MPLPFKLEKDLKDQKPLYSYKDVVELVAWALVPLALREKFTLESFKDAYPDVWDHKMIDAATLISYS
jgi:hypothetical protein